MAPRVFSIAFLGQSHPVLDLCEGLLDGIQVRGVGRQEPEAGAGRPYGGADSLGFMASEIVHDDDVARPQGFDQELFDIGQEAGAVDRAVEDAGCGDAIAAQCRQESHGAPVPVRREAGQTLALRSPAPQRRHVCFDPGLVDEDETLRIEPRLQRFPAPPPAGNRCPAPLKREQRFF